MTLNRKVAGMLYEVADLLDLDGVDFKPRAYREAAQSVEALKEDIADLHARKELEQIRGVGKSIAQKIAEIVETGALGYLEELRGKVPAGLVDVMRIPDVGPKTARRLFDELGVKDLATLRQKALSGEVGRAKGFGPARQKRMLEGLAMLEKATGRHRLDEILPPGLKLLEHLRKKAARAEIAGSLRRWKETVGDIDILATGDAKAIMAAFAGFSEVEEVLARGDKKSSVRLSGGIQADVRVVDEDSFGAALVYFTGSKEHNINLRTIAVEKGYKLNEYGLFGKDGKSLAGKTEESVYGKLGIAWIPPELREDQGEIQAARDGKLPRLLEPGDVLGDLQAHTDWTDGRNTVAEMAREARLRGLSYIAVSDHSQGLGVAGGLTAAELAQRQKEIEKARESVDFGILDAVEVDIKKDGSLDLDDRTLEARDLVLASVHSNFRMGEAEQTKRIKDAMSTGLVDVLAHPTGRKLGEREPYAVKLEAVMDAAAQKKVAMELNAQPERLDLDSSNAREARRRGVKLTIGTDAHGLSQLGFMQYGVAMARRGWLEKDDVLNTKTHWELTRYLEAR